MTQFFDTLCNNFLRNAITAAVIFGVIAVKNNTVISALMISILMIPSFLFMATAGEIVDKYPKDFIIKLLKILQFLTATLACIGFSDKNIWILLIALFCMGTFAAFLSTAKYSILPDILPQNHLLAANSIIQMMVFFAILGGTVFGGIIFSFKIYILYTFLLITSVLGVIFAFFIPRQNNYFPDTTIHINPIIAIIKNITFMLEYKSIFYSINAISWFWFVGTIMISAIPTFSKEVINGDNTIFTLLIILFTIGLSVGTLSCQSILKGKITYKHILPCLSVIVLSLIDLTYASSLYTTDNKIATLRYFITEWQGLHIILGILIFSIAGGIYIVPLTTMLQIMAPTNARAKIIASNNIINALFMILGSCLCALFLWLKIKTTSIFFILAILNSIIIIYFALKK